MHANQPTFSLVSAICRSPVAKLFNLPELSDNLDSSGAANPAFVASARSAAFASKIRCCLLVNRSARVFTAAARSAAEIVCNFLLPMRAKLKLIRLLMCNHQLGTQVQQVHSTTPATTMPERVSGSPYAPFTHRSPPWIRQRWRSLQLTR